MNDSREPSVPPRIDCSHRHQAGAADRLDGVVDDLRVTVEHCFHVAVLLLDLDVVGRARIVLHHLLDDVFQQRLLLLQPSLGEVAHDEVERRLLQRAGDADRMQEAFAALGRLGRACPSAAAR